MQKTIGGEFEINSLQSGSYAARNRSYQYYSSGRAALYAIIRYLIKSKTINRILLPDYLCSSIVDTVIKSGVKYTFYAIRTDLQPDIKTLSNLIEINDVILVINYFGLLNLDRTYIEIRKISNQVVIIEDDVQSLRSFLPSLSDNVDYSFTSLRKWLPVPDGGLTRSKKGISLPIPNESNTFSQYKLSGLLLKGNRQIGIKDDSIYLSLLEKGEALIDKNLDSTICDYTLKSFSTLEISLFFNIRKRNSKYLIAGLKEIGLDPIVNVPSEAVPLFIPIWLKDRDTVRKAMFKENIFCPVHWPQDGLNLKKGEEMAHHELSLIIDHRYNYSDLDRILNVLAKNVN